MSLSTPRPPLPDSDEHALSVLQPRAADLRPIGNPEYAARRVRLASLLANSGRDAFLAEPGGTLRYLTGLEHGLSERLFALVVIEDGNDFLVCPSFEVEGLRPELARLGLEGLDLVPWEEHEHPFHPLAAALASRRIERLAVDPWLRFHFVHGLQRKLGADHVEHGQELVLALRGQKDAHELALLRRANEITQAALAFTGEHLRPGWTAARIGAFVTRAQERMGLAGIWNLTLIGARAALPHGRTDHTPLCSGDALLIDTGGSLHGYQSDETRSWVFDGKPTVRYQKAWDTVRDAQRRAFDTLRPGVPCREVDAAARAVIAESGFGAGYRAFTHRLGHGIGLEGHEAPFLDGGSGVRLAPGMTFSDEPGIYLAGELGVRLEDIVVVTDDGADHFGGWQKGPMSAVSE